jgi:hypothetical protein
VESGHGKLSRARLCLFQDDSTPTLFCKKKLQKPHDWQLSGELLEDLEHVLPSPLMRKQTKAQTMMQPLPLPALCGRETDVAKLGIPFQKIAIIWTRSQGEQRGSPIRYGCWIRWATCEIPGEGGPRSCLDEDLPSKFVTSLEADTTSSKSSRRSYLRCIFSLK